MNKYLVFKCSLFLVQIFFGRNVSAQNRIIRGTVTDAETHSPIGFCSVIISSSALGITTDANGKFKLTIPEKLNLPKLAISYLGYKTDTVILLPEKNNYSITLMPRQGLLNEIGRA